MLILFPDSVQENTYQIRFIHSFFPLFSQGKYLSNHMHALFYSMILSGKVHIYFPGDVCSFFLFPNHFSGNVIVTSEMTCVLVLYAQVFAQGKHVWQIAWSSSFILCPSLHSRISAYWSDYMHSNFKMLCPSVSSGYSLREGNY